ncbi:MAG TPA: phosphatidate cytidylyltransferase [Vicinamibacterales bacterium]|nr:phosphatidate cytidylyltransferase [Vicinamibacterales bacterium]
MSRELLYLLLGVLALLVLASIIGRVLQARARNNDAGRSTVDNLVARIKAWWVMCGIFALTLAVGRIGSLVLFGLLSFLALREFITLTRTHRADHRTLFWAFFVFTPAQYWLVGVQWYGMFALLIPVYAFLFVAARVAAAGDTRRFLERAAEIHFGLMLCVFAVSHAPALLMLDIPGYSGQNASLLMFLVLVAQMSDVLQYVWGKLLGRHRIAPNVSPNKTVEGFVGGVATAVLIGTSLWWVTPFSPFQAAGMSAAIALMGFFGGLVMSAVKRDRGVKDFGTVIEGHGGILDRIDSICFAAPVFFHLTRYYFT